MEDKIQTPIISPPPQDKVKFTITPEGNIEFEGSVKDVRQAEDLIAEILDRSQHRVSLHNRHREVETSLTHKVKMMAESKGQGEFLIFVIIVLGILALTGVGLGNALKQQCEVHNASKNELGFYISRVG